MPVLVRRIAPFRVLLTATKSAPTALLVTDVSAPSRCLLHHRLRGGGIGCHRRCRHDARSLERRLITRGALAESGWELLSRAAKPSRHRNHRRLGVVETMTEARRFRRRTDRFRALALLVHKATGLCSIPGRRNYRWS
jgi:hypothetical protein